MGYFHYLLPSIPQDAFSYLSFLLWKKKCSSHDPEFLFAFVWLPWALSTLKSETLPFSRKTDVGKVKLLVSREQITRKGQAGRDLAVLWSGRMEMKSPG